MKIVISSGHGKYVQGANGILNEVTEARKIVPQVVNYLRQLGVEVVEYHDDTSKNQTDNVNGIVAFHNQHSRDLDVSVHLNSAGYTDQPRGVEVLYWDAANLAARIAERIASASGLRNRGAKQRQDLGFLKRTTRQAILIEVCFVDSTVDVSLYQTNFNNICKAIAEGITDRSLAESQPILSPQPNVYAGNSIVDYLKSIGQDSSMNNRRELANRFGIANYTGTASQNTALLKKMRGA